MEHPDNKFRSREKTIRTQENVFSLPFIEIDTRRLHAVTRKTSDKSSYNVAY